MGTYKTSAVVSYQIEVKHIQGHHSFNRLIQKHIGFLNIYLLSKDFLLDVINCYVH